MSKQRLYRAKVKSDDPVISKRWAYGDRVKIGERVFIVPDDAEVDSHAHGDDYIIGIIEVIPSSVGQSTGKEDRDKGEMYGGDRIRPWEDDDRILVVVWDDEHACWGTVDWEGKRYMQLGMLDLRKVYKVIGSTTDTPELLEETEK